MQQDSPPEFAQALLPGGQIPGSGGLPAFFYRQSEASPIPVLIAAPHGGRSYPDALAAMMRNPGPAAMRLEDLYTDLLAARLAEETGADLLIAHAPRAMIDLNRSLDDMDWKMVDRPAPFGSGAVVESRRMRSGLGLVPRRLTGLGEIWKAPMSVDDLEDRVRCIHAPYHDRLGSILGRLRRRWGAALLIDLHSMPPLAPAISGRPPARIVLGDRFGASCTGSLAGVVFDELAIQGVHAAHNRPYAGGYMLERHCNPAAGLHGLQLEVCRSLYLDGRLAEPGRGMQPTLAILTGLVRRLAEEVAAMGKSGYFSLAAE